tara:strand:- start:1771 stop:3342 length:1572 start_codon:yes stop_codon:yes gene_type:complete
MFNKIKYYLLLIIIPIAIFGYNNIKSKDSYNKLKTFTEVLRLVNDNYYEDVDLDKIIDGAIVGMLDELDPHSTYIPSESLKNINEQFAGKFEGIGIEFDILDNYITVISPIPGTPSDRAGLQSGDKLIEINDTSAYKITFDEVFNKLRGPKGSKVKLTIKRPNIKETINITLIRDEIPIFSVLASFLIDNITGYVKINRFSSTTSEEFQNAVDLLLDEGMQQLVIDLRNNGGGLMDEAIKMVDLFVSSNDKILITKGKIIGSDNIYYASKKAPYKNIPVITIINRGSASASEIVSGAFQDLDRGIVVGETSFGKGLVQRQFPIYSDGSAARITIARYYTPSGRLIQRDYDETYEEYYSDLIQENREATDSTLNEKPKYLTLKGRTVFGGGGITPDYHIPSKNELSETSLNILTHPDRIIFNFASQLNPTVNQLYLNYNDFYEKYQISKKEKITFIDVLKQKNINYDNEELNNDWNYIENRIKAEIASSIWGKQFLFKTNVKTDDQVQAVFNYFKEASKLIQVN